MLLDVSASPLSYRARPRRVVPQGDHRGSHRVGVADGDEDAGDAVLDHVHLTLGPRADDGLAHRHRLQDDRDPVVGVGGAERHDDEA